MDAVKREIEVLDSMLRDGAQGEGISFSVEDKLKIVMQLDALGVKYIEAGNVTSNPKDIALFEKLKDMSFKNSKIVAFGSTRRKNTSVAEDEGLNKLVNCGAPTVAVFGKSWDLHVVDVLSATLEENLQMIKDTVIYCKQKGLEVIFDAEHFFDGFANNADYAIQVVDSAFDAGADCVTLCDTNGGTFPMKLFEIVKLISDRHKGKRIGIHCHNDKGFAVANTVLAVETGACHIQGTLIGVGERCGNANLSTIIPDLQLSYGYKCIPQDKMAQLTPASRFVADIANIHIENTTPYIGKSAFAHKAGMHADGVKKNKKSFEHIAPETVGNERRFLVSEIAGRASLISKINSVSPDITKDSQETKNLLESIKKLEHQGFSFESAEASLELLIRKELGQYTPYFELINFKIINEQPSLDANTTTASIKIRVGDSTEITSAEGDGPVNALDNALRKAMEVFYPVIGEVHLIDYKVRVFDTHEATASTVRVLIETTDGKEIWTTVGASTDIIKASWIALEDSINYKLMKG